MGAMFAKLTVEDIIDPGQCRDSDDCGSGDSCCWEKPKKPSKNTSFLFLDEQASIISHHQNRPGSASSSVRSSARSNQDNKSTIIIPTHRGVDSPSVTSNSTLNSNALSSHASSNFNQKKKQNNDHSKARDGGGAATKLFHSTSSVTSGSTLSTTVSSSQSTFTCSSTSSCNSALVSQVLLPPTAAATTTASLASPHHYYDDPCYNYRSLLTGRGRQPILVTAAAASSNPSSSSSGLPKTDDSLPPPSVEESSSKKVVAPTQKDLIVLSASLAQNGSYMPVHLSNSKVSYHYHQPIAVRGSTALLPHQKHQQEQQQQQEQQYSLVENAFQKSRYDSRTWNMYQRIADDRVRQLPSPPPVRMHSDGGMMYPDHHQQYYHHHHQQQQQQHFPQNYPHWQDGGGAASSPAGPTEQDMVFSCDMD